MLCSTPNAPTRSLRVVALRHVLLQRLLGDRAHVADDVAGERRVRIDPLPLLDDLDAGEVLAALLADTSTVSSSTSSFSGSGSSGL